MAFLPVSALSGHSGPLILDQTVQYVGRAIDGLHTDCCPPKPHTASQPASIDFLLLHMALKNNEIFQLFESVSGELVVQYTRLLHLLSSTFQQARLFEGFSQTRMSFASFGVGEAVMCIVGTTSHAPDNPHL